MEENGQVVDVLASGYRAKYDPCRACGTDDEWGYRNGERACRNCGVIDPGYREYSYLPIWDDMPAGRGPSDNGVRVPGDWISGGTRGRYKEKFHYNERIAQWCLVDPPIPKGDWERIRNEAKTGNYGDTATFTRASVIHILAKLGLQKYRERWKSILSTFNPSLTREPPNGIILEWCEEMFPLLVHAFQKFKGDMPKSLHRGKDGRTTSRARHNFLSYNYTQRKLLESWGLYEYHYEFPVPRSHGKLHALDDVMENMCDEVGIPFIRSTVIKRPKLRRK